METWSREVEEHSRGRRPEGAAEGERKRLSCNTKATRGKVTGLECFEVLNNASFRI